MLISWWETGFLWIGSHNMNPLLQSKLLRQRTHGLGMAVLSHEVCFWAFLPHQALSGCCDAAQYWYTSALCCCRANLPDVGRADTVLPKSGLLRAWHTPPKVGLCPLSSCLPSENKRPLVLNLPGLPGKGSRKAQDRLGAEGCQSPGPLCSREQWLSRRLVQALAWL